MRRTTQTGVTLALALWSSAALLAPGCSGTGMVDDRACSPGSTRECSCDDQETGQQGCNDATLQWEPCDCGTNGSGGSGGTCSNGTEGCPCYGNDTCNDFLNCVDGTCVELGIAGAVGMGGTVPVLLGGGPGLGGGGFGVPPCDTVVGLPPTCEFAAVEMDPIRPNVLLLIDKSGSMADQPAGYTLSKWETLEVALAPTLVQVAGGVAFGLEMFPTTASLGNPIPFECGDSGRCCEMPRDGDLNVPVDVGTSAVSEVINALAESAPAGGTPMSVALYRALEYFTNGHGAALEGDKYVLLIVDGAPNCNAEATCDVTTCTLNVEDVPGCPPDGASCCGSYPEACLDLATALQQVVDLRVVGVTTIVVALPGSDFYDSVYQDLANAGGFERPDGSTSYYGVSAQGGVDELTDTLQSILGQLLGECVLPIEGEIPNRNQLNVAVDCQVVPRGNGATPTDVSHRRYNNADPSLATAAIVAGPLCGTLQSTGVGRIDLIQGCETVELQ